MDIKWIGASTNNYDVGRGGKSINKIVLHWMVGTLESCDVTFNNPDRLASAHYGIGENEIHQYVKEDDTAWHASNYGVNQESIGIEHEGGWLLGDGTRKKPSDAVHQKSGELVADICRRHNLPIDRNTIHIHKEFSATQCPGSLDVNRIIEIAKGINTPVTDPDKVKIDLGEPYGVLEAQAIRSMLNDLNRDLKNCEKNCQNQIDMAVEQATINCERDWQSKLETANQEIIRLNTLNAENMSYSDLFSMAFKKLWIFRKGGGNT